MSVVGFVTYVMRPRAASMTVRRPVVTVYRTSLFTSEFVLVVRPRELVVRIQFSEFAVLQRNAQRLPNIPRLYGGQDRSIGLNSHYGRSVVEQILPG